MDPPQQPQSTQQPANTPPPTQPTLPQTQQLYRPTFPMANPALPSFQLGFLPNMTNAPHQVPLMNPTIGTTPAPPMMPYITDPAMLSQLTGIPLKTLQGPGMMQAAHQILHQRLVHQHLMAAQMQRPGMRPFFASIQQQQLQQQNALNPVSPSLATATATAKTKGKPRGKLGSKSSTPAHAKYPNRLPYDPANKQDPGGKIIWAKLPNLPWWPAKTLDETKDRSYPLDAEPPRPTSYGVRLFGTYEFAWIGSKRQVTDWEEGRLQYSKESNLEVFLTAIKEADTYSTEKVLPDAFFIAPEAAESGKKTKAKRRSGGTTNPQHAVDAGNGAVIQNSNAPFGFSMDGTFLGGISHPPATGTAPLVQSSVGQVGTAQQTANKNKSRSKSMASKGIDRTTLVQIHKRRHLLRNGLLAPESSPYAKGKLAANASLLKLKDEWELVYPDEMRAAREEAMSCMETAPRALRAQIKI